MVSTFSSRRSACAFLWTLPNLKHAYAKSWYFKIATFRSSNAKRLHLTEIVWPGGASHNPPSAGEALELRA